MPITSLNIPLLDLRPQFAQIRDEVMQAIARVAESQRFILGREVERFEQQAAEYCDVRYAVGCASGTDALFLALKAAGVGPGDEVLTVPYSFFATASEIHRVGAKIVFVDVDRRTFNIDVNQIEDALRKRPGIRAVIPVHLFGGCADMQPILGAAMERGIPVIEDAAQAIGSEYRGKRAGGIGTAATFSFFPSKNLGAYGDGGLVTTNDEQIARRIRSLRVHGSETKYVHDEVGINSRLDEIQAAVLGVKLKYLDGWSRRRQENAALYRRLLAESGAPVTLPVQTEYQTRHIYNQFVITGARRDDLRAFLREHGVGTEVYYPIPLHMQRCFAYLGHREGDFPVSEALARESLALPIHPDVSRDDIAAVVELIASFYSGKA